MATVVQINDLLVARIWCVLGNQAAVNTFGFRCVNIAGTGGTDQKLAEVIDPTTASFYKTILADQAVYRGVQVYFLQRVGALPPPVFTIGSTGNGTGGVNGMPLNTCPIMKYSTFARGPGGRGRIFLPFCAADTTGPTGEPTAGFNGAVNAFATVMLIPITFGVGGNNSTVRWSLIHRGPVLSATDMLNASSSGKIGQMHKRGDYGRPNTSPI